VVCCSDPGKIGRHRVSGVEMSTRGRLSSE
jgi:hypothetical protein